jgi:two-component system LytT family sensor kinase
MKRNLAIRGLWILTAWTLYGLFSASQLVARNYNAQISWKLALGFSFLDSYLWAVLTPVLFVVAGRLVVQRSNCWWTLPLLFAGGLLFGGLHLALFLRTLPLLGYSNSPNAVRNMFRQRYHADILTCWIVFAMRHAMEYYRQFRLRELRASQLEAQLALTQLEVLKMQLQPHFLFNTLHAISTLMYRDVDGADRMISRLSDFLRLTLNSAGEQEVTLKREMESLDKYLEIEQVRFGDRLEVRRSIAPETLDLFVPNLILQPLVENAVRHGIAPHASRGRIEVRARSAGGSLEIVVCDDGPGPKGEIREGVGISRTRARLDGLYGAASRFEMRLTPGSGFQVLLTIPAHTEATC